MGDVEDIEQRLPVLRRSVSERTGSAVFQGNGFMILHLVLPSVQMPVFRRFKASALSCRMSPFVSPWRTAEWGTGNRNMAS